MADDRNDMRGRPGERPRSSDERFRERGMGEQGQRGRDDRSPDDRGRDEPGRDERGFFERAGEEISSWFWDDDSNQRRRDEPGQRRPANEPMSGRDPEHRSSNSREPGREPGRNQPMGQQPAPRGAWRSSEDQGDHQRGPRREPPQQPWGGNEPAERGAYRPMAGDYGRSEQPYAGGGGGHFDRDSSWGREDSQRSGASQGRSRSNDPAHDPHYQQWRQQQIEALDRDYEEYRREHQSKFENDFGSWRSNRQTRRQMLGQVREHMSVIGSDEEPVGTVDRVAGDRIILAKSDEAGGAQHSLSCSEIERIEENRVVLSTSGAQARNRWRDESRERALFEREDQGESGPHTLDRSFSGTYR